jgi:hypothetical protein
MTISAIIGFLSGVATMIVKFMDWLHDKNLVESGKAQQQLNDLRGQIHDVQIAMAAREAVRADILVNDGKLPINDPFRRD